VCEPILTGETNTPILPTRTIPPANTQAATQTSWPTFTPTITPTATRTPTITPTPRIDGACIGTEYQIPVSPGTISLTLRYDQKFYIADAPIFVNFAQPRELPPGAYSWAVEGGSYTFYSLTTPARLLLCDIGIEPTITPTPTTDTLPGAECADCVSIAPVTPEIANLAPMTGLGIAVPTLRILPTITSTIQISITAIIGSIQTIEANILTPVAAVETAAAGYSWETGATQGEEWAGWLATGLEWLAIINPQNPAWQANGGALWAIAPAFLPILPIILVMAIVATLAFLIYFFNWLITIFDIIVKLIELIPGE
jgi:hypothetical protein